MNIFNLKIIPTNFIFLRPYYLLLLIPIGVLCIVFLYQNKKNYTWIENIPETLRPYVLTKDGVKRFSKSKLLLIVGYILLVLSISGPANKKQDNYGNKLNSSLIIALDVSNSMLAEDIKPNRLERAKLKINDLLDNIPEMQVSVLVYAGSAHVLVPFTNDYRIIKSRLKAVKPSIMPKQGSSIEEAFKLSEELLIENKKNCTILFVTDNLNKENLNIFKKEDTGKLYESLIISSTDSVKIPLANGRFMKYQGKEIFLKLDNSILSEFDFLENMNVTQITLDESDIFKIKKNIESNSKYFLNKDLSQEDWIDMGYYLIPLCLLICLFWFRRGWNVEILLLLVVLNMSSCTFKDIGDKTQIKGKFIDLWLTQDQQASYLLLKKDTLGALEKFQDKEWKAYLYYKNKNYKQSEILYLKDTNAISYYNLGVVLVKQNRYKLASKAFQVSIKLDSNLICAQKNHALIMQYLKAKSKAYEFTNSHKKPKSLKDEIKDIENEISSIQNADSTLFNIKKNAVLVKSNNVKRELDIDEILQYNNKQKKISYKNVVLKEISSDPSEFLRRQFLYQYTKSKTKNNLFIKPW